jgi:hypothetical protein
MDITTTSRRLRRLLLRIEKEDARRKRFDQALRSAMRNGLGGMSEIVVRKALAKRYAVPQAKKKNLRRLSRASQQRLKLQGQYMGSIRNLTLEKRAAVRSLLKEKGIRAALAHARELSSSKG